VAGAKGVAPPETYKVSVTYRAGYKAEAYLAFFGDQAKAKALKAGEMIFYRVKEAGYSLEKTCLETIGAGGVVPGMEWAPSLECALHIAARSSEKAPLEYFAKQIAPLVTSGPQGTTGYISGRPEVRPVFGFWPCLIHRDSVSAKIEIV
jgi:hypothetical protein